jgi:hypothetical protein
MPHRAWMPHKTTENLKLGCPKWKFLAVSHSAKFVARGDNSNVRPIVFFVVYGDAAK